MTYRINSISKIYFDLDGVLSDFDKGVRVMCGMEPLPQGRHPAGYDERLWSAVKAAGNFYYRLEVLPDGKHLFDTLSAMYPDKCEILTGIPRPSRGIDSAADDKVRWVRHYISPDIPVHTVMRKDKPLFCYDSGCVLIDDYECNVSEWNNAGGIGILFTNAEEALRHFMRQ